MGRTARIRKTVDFLDTSISPSTDWATLNALPSRERFRRIRNDSPWQDLADRLLSLGGTTVYYRPEPYAAALLRFGKRFRSTNTLVIPGLPNRCHENAATYWLQHRKEAVIVMGWALTRDDAWRQHTWVWRHSDGQWVESGVRRELGFGMLLTDPEAKSVCLSQAPDAFAAFLMAPKSPSVP